MSDHKAAEQNALDLLDDLIGRARAAGADGADAVLFESVSLGASCRLGVPEDVHRAESRDLGLRVFIGKRQAFVSSTDWASTVLDELVGRALDMARLAPEDPHCGLAEPDLLATELVDLDLFDPAEPDARTLMARAETAEAAARAVDGVTNSEGGGASWGRGSVALATSGGYAGAYSTSSHSVSCSVIAGGDDSMERDYDFASSRHLADLDDAAAIGRSAGERAVRRLGPRKVKSCQVPVVFDPRVADSLLRHFAGAINGQSVARGTSFLKDRMDEPVFADGITVVDDPHRCRGLRSKPVDGEGIANRRHDLVADGRLTTWLLDSASASQLGLRSTGHGARGTAAPPAPATTNLYMAPGTVGPAALIADIAAGLYITELIGFGVNQVTGDYSRGASGFWIENGERTYPVSELTVAGNLKEMFRALVPADDLVFRHGTNAPTLRIEGMTVAGT